MKADVVVVGGGIIGCACAYYLSSAKKRVILVERGEICSETSSSCDGFVILQSKSPGIHLELALESAARYECLDRELDCELEYRRTGGMIVIETQEQLAVMEAIARRQEAGGLPVQMLGPVEARRREPVLSRHILGATYSPLDGQVNPMHVTLAFARAAARNGATLMEHTPVLELEAPGGVLWGVRTNRGFIAAPAAVVATGVFAPELLEPLGLEVPIRPRRGQVLVTEQAPPLLTGVMLCARYLAIKYRPELAQDASDPGLRLGVGFGLEQADSGNILISNTREFAGFDKNPTPEGIREILRYATRLAPALEHLHIIRAFAGLRPYTPDGLPLLGQVPGTQGVWVAAGHEGDGVALAPITGLLMSQLVSGTGPAFPVEPFSPGRF
ncbi:MAG: FAD-binding oxidoreductase [Bacillota bacterium]